ncbi:alpha/beta hydrolase [Acidobacteriota bacterium]
MSLISTIGIVLVSIAGAYIIFMLIMGLLPRKPILLQPLTKTKPHISTEPSSQKSLRKNIHFEVKGISLSAWLYLPENSTANIPCIILAHGLGGTKDLGLDSYARRYQKEGFAVFVFDYRYLGESGGEPRQLVWIPHQLKDWADAVEYVRNLKEIDPNKIALWGTSLSGGHVIVTAAKYQNIACISAQVPLLDGAAGGMKLVKKMGFTYLLRMAFGHGLRDIVRSWLGLSSYKIPLVGQPHTVAAMADAEAWNAFNVLAPDNFINEICARILIRMDKYHPIKYASNIRCPVLIQICDKDITTTPEKLVKTAKNKLGTLAEVIHYPLDHFDIYLGDNFEKSVSDQIIFFKKHLL